MEDGGPHFPTTLLPPRRLPRGDGGGGRERSRIRKDREETESRKVRDVISSEKT